MDLYIYVRNAESRYIQPIYADISKYQHRKSDDRDTRQACWSIITFLRSHILTFSYSPFLISYNGGAEGGGLLCPQPNLHTFNFNAVSAYLLIILYSLMESYHMLVCTQIHAKFYAYKQMQSIIMNANKDMQIHSNATSTHVSIYYPYLWDSDHMLVYTQIHTKTYKYKQIHINTYEY